MFSKFPQIIPAIAISQLFWSSSAEASSNSNGYNCEMNPFKYVIQLSIDGMHGSDVGKWIAVRPSSNFSRLLQYGYEYTDAFTSAPSDSFPGTLAQYTGASPRTTGVWYDDTWDWSYYAPGSGCAGKPGAEVLYDETIDYNDTMLFSGGINAKNLPMRKTINGTCEEVYPHQRLRVNTIFEVVKAAGHETAYTDKHPAYDMLRGPSGTGLNVGYFPEVATVSSAAVDIIAYDQLHVNAWLDWLDAKTPVNSTIYDAKLTKVPTLFGGNFQSFSVVQKTIGYNNDTQNSLSDPLIMVMDFIDSSVGAIMNKLEGKGLLNETLIIVASKHGQAPIERSLYRAIDPTAVTNLTTVPLAWATTDDIALLFLNHSSDTSKAVAELEAGAKSAGIRSVIWGQNLTDSGFGNPAIDPAVPDIIVEPELGVVYTSSFKDMEHGGISQDDRHVACILSSPKLKKRTFAGRVSTQQIAPTVLKALGISRQLLQGAAAEGVLPLPGFM